jgi:Fur family zinc uptake transcriptional regulator
MITNSKLAYHHHDHQRCIDAALTQAKAVCDTKNMRLTATRQQVLKLIWQNHQPLGAYKLLELLARENGKQVMPPTIYRALDFLLAAGLIHRISSLNAFIGCPFPSSSHNEVFLICSNCGSAAECSADKLSSAITETASKANFTIESQSVEIVGLCPTCKELSVDNSAFKPNEVQIHA